MSAQPTASGPAWDRLEDQVGWYDRKSQGAQRAYKRLKVLQLVAAAAVPVVAAAEAAAWITAGFGGVVLVLEGVQQLGQYQSNWITYRSTCEALKHEKYLYLAGAGPYSNSEDRSMVLAEHVEGLVSRNMRGGCRAARRRRRQRARLGRPAERRPASLGISLGVPPLAPVGRP